MHCTREGCVTCEQQEEKKLDCFARSIVYESSCTLCYPGGKTDKQEDKMIMSGKGIYTGETSRSLGERAGEHMGAARILDRGSHMVKHWFLDHPGEGTLPAFKFRVIGKYKDCLTRQLKEAIRVQNRPDNLNSKGEFGGQTIPRLVIEKPDWERKKEEIEKAKREEQENRRWEKFISGKIYQSTVSLEGEELGGQQFIEWRDASQATKDTHNVEETNDTTTWASTTPCPVGVKNETHTHSAETNHHHITAGAETTTPTTAVVPTTPCPVGQVQDDVTIVPPRVNSVEVRGGGRGKGSAFMTVQDISDDFKNTSAKSNFWNI